MSPSSDGCHRRETGSVQIHLKLIGVRQLRNPYLGCLQEPQENLYVPVMEQRSAQIHQSTNHTLQECKSFKGMLTSEKEKVVEEQKLCLCCLFTRSSSG